MKKIKQRLRVLLQKYPRLHTICRRIQRFLFNNKNFYPRTLGLEEQAIAEVLISSSWNICYSRGYSNSLAHEDLEENFAEYVGAKYGVAVNTGGMAIQMSLRALGIKPGDEIIHQVDTCVANAFSIINAQAVPIFADISLDSFMLSKESIESLITENTKAIMPIHIWGNPENMDMINEVAKKNNLLVIEDACQSLGAAWNSKKVGSFGDVAIFSFGCLKPIQTGEGGMIVTNDETLARELRVIRSYGDRAQEYGIRDNETLSWNGRISEILAAVGKEQLKGYNKFLSEIEANVSIFKYYLDTVMGIQVVDQKNKKAYTQLVLKIDPKEFPISKKELFELLKMNGINVWHANFEPINSLSFFKQDTWREWILKGDMEKISSNYSELKTNSQIVYDHIGIGLQRSNFLSRKRALHLIGVFKKILNR